MRQVPPLPEIECAICKKLCDRVEMEQMLHRHAMRIRVWCHDDQDEMILDAYDMQSARPEELRRGVAFTTKRITGP